MPGRSYFVFVCGGGPGPFTFRATFSRFASHPDHAGAILALFHLTRAKMHRMVTQYRLNPRQQAFCRYYVATGNASEAFRQAGYSPKNADANAAKLMVKESIRAEIASIRRDVEIESTVDKAFVISNLRENVARAMQQIPVFDREGNETGEWTYQGSIANRALELLGKSVGLFVEVLDVHTTTHDPAALEHLKQFTADQLRFMLAADREQQAIEVDAKVVDAGSTEVE